MDAAGTGLIPASSPGAQFHCGGLNQLVLSCDKRRGCHGRLDRNGRASDPRMRMALGGTMIIGAILLFDFFISGRTILQRPVGVLPLKCQLFYRQAVRT